MDLTELQRCLADVDMDSDTPTALSLTLDYFASAGHLPAIGISAYYDDTRRFEFDRFMACPDYLRSHDAALALVERLGFLPSKIEWADEEGAVRVEAVVYDPLHQRYVGVRAPTAPHAIVSAVVAALIARGTSALAAR